MRQDRRWERIGRGICHCDLKPDNLMIRAKSGEPVLIDFSIAIVKSPRRLVMAC